MSWHRQRRVIPGGPWSRVQGFTLIEMIVVLAIAALLASIALPLTELASRRTKEEELRAALREIRGALDRYKAASDEGRIRRDPTLSGYPRTLVELVDGVEDQKDPQRSKLYFLRRVPRDPFAANDIASPEQTWRLRSYRSSAADPKPGDDVYDIKSSSDQIGLNGVPYAKW